MTLTALQSPKPRFESLDLIRVIACFWVVWAHCTDPYIFFGDEVATAGALSLSFYRPCVPFFVMLSGALLLPMRGTAEDFFKRRFTRVLIPFLIWGVIYAFLKLPPEAIFEPKNNLGTWTQEYPTLFGLLMLPFNFTKSNIHFWFVYALIGLYLIVPVISPWIERATKKGLIAFLSIWGVTLFIPYLRLVFPEIHGVCDWNEFSMLHYFSGYIGYFVLGHFLVKYNTLSLKKALAIGLPLWVGGFILTFIGFLYTVEYKTCNKDLELAVYNLNFNVVMMTLGLFIILQKVKIGGYFKPAVQKLSVLSFGIFLVHYIVVLWGMHYIVLFRTKEVIPFLNANSPALASSANTWLPFFELPLAAVTLFAVSALLAWLVSFLPKREWFIG